MIRSECLKDDSDCPVKNRLDGGKRGGRESSMVAEIQMTVNEAA